MTLFILTFILLSVSLAGIAVGVFISPQKQLPQSCGGVANNPDCCMKCPDKKPECEHAHEHKKVHPSLRQTTASSRGEPFALS
jgi:hypothetical protein